MKKQRFFMLGIITVLVAVLSLTFVSSTFAKYTSTVAGEDSARVAKWAWTYKGAELTTDTVSFDLFDTILDSDMTNAETDVDVDGSGSERVIAPGTFGQFVIEFANNSEVNATYAIDFEVTNANNIPVEFSLDGTTWDDDLADVAATAIAMNGGAAQYTVKWRWAFSNGDAADQADTTLGVAGTASIKVRATVTFTQVD